MARKGSGPPACPVCVAENFSLVGSNFDSAKRASFQRSAEITGKYAHQI
jgi:hypothetical protein